MIYDHQIFGGVVDPAQRWVNSFGDALFHEWGSLPGGGYQSGCFTRVGFTAPTDGLVEVKASIKQRTGNVSGTTYYGRIYAKARIVQYLPTLNELFANYLESDTELNPAYPIVRYADVPFTPYIIVPVTAGQTYQFGVEYLAGDGASGEIDFGSTLTLRD